MMMVKIPDYSDEQLKAMGASGRHTIYKRARALGTPGALKLCERLDRLGLPYSDDSTVHLDDPIVLKMHEIVNSKEGVDAMLQAFSNGLPPLTGVDPMLAAALGVDYGKHNMTTHTAGAIVAERMTMMGFRKIPGRQKPLPPGCVARSAVMFRGK
jgi:hypothetical protein